MSILNKKQQLALAVSAVLGSMALGGGPALAVECGDPCTVTGSDAPEVHLIDSTAGALAWEIETNANGQQFVIGLNGGTAEPFKIEDTAPENLLYLDPVGIGIKTSAPATDIHVVDPFPEIRLDDSSAGAGQADINVTNTTFEIEDSGGSRIFGFNTETTGVDAVFMNADGSMELDNGSVFIDTANRVGIGTTAPEQSLDVEGGQIQLNSTGDPGGWWLNTGGTGLWFNNNDGTTTSPVKFNNNAPSDSLVVEGTTGDIGIGTATPAVQLDVVGNQIRLNGTGRTIAMRTDGNHTDVEAQGADLYLRSSSVDQNIIMNPFTNDGSVIIGTTVLDGATPELQVEDAQDTLLLVKNSAATATDQTMFRLEAGGTSKVRFELVAGGGTDRWTFDNIAANDKFGFSRVGTGATEFTLDPNGNGVFRGTVTANGVLLTSAKSRKTDFTPIDDQEILSKVAGLDVAQWRYKAGDEGQAHIGPYAEEFQQAFGLGDGKTINMIDASGVAFAAIQGLNQAVEEKDAQIAELKARMAQLESMIQELVPQQH